MDFGSHDERCLGRAALFLQRLSACQCPHRGAKRAANKRSRPHDGRPVEPLPPEHRQYRRRARSEEHTSELQSLMRISYAVFCLKKKRYTSTNKAHTKLLTHNHKKKRITTHYTN